MTNSLATQNDVEQMRQYFAAEIGTLARELSEHRRQLRDNDETHADERRESERRWQQATVSTAVRTRLWVAAMTATSVVLVAVIQVVFNHSYAVAREQMREVTRQELVKSSEAQSAHDELLIKRTLDERDRRIDQLIIQAKVR